MAAIDDALAACDLADVPNYAQIAREFGVNRSTLSRRHRGIIRAAEDLHESQQLLSESQEKELVKYINRLNEKGIPPTCPMVRNFAAEIAQIQPGQKWPYRFVQRHKDELKSCYLEGLDLSRKRAESYTNIRRYFEMVSCFDCVLD